MARKRRKKGGFWGWLKWWDESPPKAPSNPYQGRSLFDLLGIPDLPEQEDIPDEKSHEFYDFLQNPRTDPQRRLARDFQEREERENAARMAQESGEPITGRDVEQLKQDALENFRAVLPRQDMSDPSNAAWAMDRVHPDGDIETPLPFLIQDHVESNISEMTYDELLIAASMTQDELRELARGNIHFWYHGYANNIF